jgi:threonine/homoserine/homoserine lactone efflux protein
MAETKRNAPMWVTWMLAIVGVLFVVAGIVYMTRTEARLPSFFPGHDATKLTAKHTKHGLAMFGLAVLCWIGAWFSAGRAPAENAAGR